MLELDQETAGALLDWLSARRPQIEACAHRFDLVFEFLYATGHPASATLVTWLEGQDVECDCEALLFLEEYVA